MIDVDLDEALERLAASEHVSKAALIRKFVREALEPLPELSADPLGRMVGADDYDPSDIDEVVYR